MIGHVRLDLATCPGDPRRPNEDFLSAATTVDAGTVVALDGVTPPPQGETGCAHSVPWFAARLGGTLLELAASRRAVPLAECLAEAIERTAAVHGSSCDLTHRRTPQATVAVVRWDGERVEYLVLSDAAVLLRQADGTVTAILDRRLDDLRARSDHRANLEGLRNLPGGFFTAAADPAVAAYAVAGSVARHTVSAAAALTDGATRWVEVFRLGDWTALLESVRTEGARALIGRVRAAEAADVRGSAALRRKPFDDASIAYAEL